MSVHPVIKMSATEAKCYAKVCEMYCEESDIPELCVDNDTHDLFMKCKSGTFTIWHGYPKEDGGGR